MQLEQYTTPITKPNTDLAIVVAIVKEEHLEEADATFGSFEVVGLTSQDTQQLAPITIAFASHSYIVKQLTRGRIVVPEVTNHHSKYVDSQTVRNC